MRMLRRPGARFNRGRSPFARGVSGPPALPLPQSFAVTVVANSLEPLLMPQAFTVEAVAALGPTDATPLTIVSSVPVIMWLRSDLGVTESGGLVSSWVDQSPNAYTFTQGTGSAQPAYDATGGPNGTPLITGDGVDDTLLSNWNPPAPGTSPVWIWAIVKTLTQVNGDCVWGGSSTTSFLLLMLTTAGTARLANGVNGSTTSGLTVGSPRRVLALYNNDVTGYLQFGNSTRTTGSSGNNDASSFSIFSRNAGLSACHMSYLELFMCTGEPSAGELADLEAYGAARYGAGPFT